jgi:hypothetical protein
MKIIAHRGLLDGPDIDRENSPNQINEALSLGFDVEVDLWKVADRFYLGHDGPDYPIDSTFLNNDKLWIHTKNLAALEWLSKRNRPYNFFWHNVDEYVITSRNYIWTVDQENYTDNTVIVIPDYPNGKTYNCYAICCDYGRKVLDNRYKS